MENLCVHRELCELFFKKVAKFGSQTYDNEQEVLFRKGSKFRVFEVIKFSDYTLITLKEV